MVIDVMLPYYGDVGLMKDAARSVLSQQHQDWRLVVVDDGYPDPEPARWFGEMTDPRVQYERNEQNLGANGNYRKCLTLVQSPIVVVMGADDVMLPNYLQVVAEAFAAHPDAAVVETGVQVIDERGRAVHPIGDRIKNLLAPTVTKRTELRGEDLAAGLLRANWTYFPSLAWNAQNLTTIGFREGLDVVQDLALLLDTVVAGGSLVLDPTLAFLYRRHSESDSSVRALDGRRFDEERRFFAGEAESMAARGWKKAARAARWHATSRLHALSLLPAAARAHKLGAAGPTLGRHVIGR